MNDFYVNLLSKSSLDINPNNKTRSFTTHLPRKITLNEDWCVALSEITFPYNFFNVTDKNNTITVQKNGDVESFSKTIKVPVGYYTSSEYLLDVIKECIIDAGLNDILKIDYLPATCKITIIFSDTTEYDTIQFENQLGLQLGFAYNVKL